MDRGGGGGGGGGGGDGGCGGCGGCGGGGGGGGQLWRTQEWRLRGQPPSRRLCAIKDLLASDHLIDFFVRFHLAVDPVRQV